MTTVEARTMTPKRPGSTRPSTSCSPSSHRRHHVVEFLGAQFDPGSAWVHFPEGQGGLDVSPKLQTGRQRADPAGRGRALLRRNPIGHGMAGPTIVAHGSDEQKRRYLRPLFTGEEVWCQLFSEPGAGSDVAGLSAAGVRDGDEWIVNGQKVWTTLAHLVDVGMLVSRTDPDVAEAQGSHVLRGRHARARRRGATAAPDHR